jgi:hypothetical protein
VPSRADDASGRGVRNYLAVNNVKSFYGVIELVAKPLWLLSLIAPSITSIKHGITQWHSLSTM